MNFNGKIHGPATANYRLRIAFGAATKSIVPVALSTDTLSPMTAGSPPMKSLGNPMLKGLTAANVKCADSVQRGGEGKT